MFCIRYTSIFTLNNQSRILRLFDFVTLLNINYCADNSEEALFEIFSKMNDIFIFYLLL